MNSSVVSFFQDLGRRISQVLDSWEASYLFQCIGVTTQHFNSVLFRDFRFPGRFRCLATTAFDFNFFELIIIIIIIIITIIMMMMLEMVFYNIWINIAMELFVSLTFVIMYNL